MGVNLVGWQVNNFMFPPPLFTYTFLKIPVHRFAVYATEMSSTVRGASFSGSGANEIHRQVGKIVYLITRVCSNKLVQDSARRTDLQLQCQEGKNAAPQNVRLRVTNNKRNNLTIFSLMRGFEH